MTSRRNLNKKQLAQLRKDHLDRKNTMSAGQPLPPGMIIDPTQREQQARMIAAKLVMEISSSIYVRIISDKLGDPFRGPDSDINDPEKLAEYARDSFIAGRIFLQVANEPVDADQQKAEQKAAGPKDANKSPLVQP